MKEFKEFCRIFFSFICLIISIIAGIIICLSSFRKFLEYKKR